jgi:hypothetical protein
MVGGDGPSYPQGLGLFLKLPGKFDVGLFLRPGDVKTCLDFQFA